MIPFVSHPSGNDMSAPEIDWDNQDLISKFMLDMDSGNVLISFAANLSMATAHIAPENFSAFVDAYEKLAAMDPSELQGNEVAVWQDGKVVQVVGFPDLKPTDWYIEAMLATAYIKFRDGKGMFEDRTRLMWHGPIGTRGTFLVETCNIQKVAKMLRAAIPLVAAAVKTMKEGTE